MKTEVYSWRLSTALKSSLQHEARRRKISLSTALDIATQEWLDRAGKESDDGEEQRKLHARAEEAIGTLDGGGARSENVRTLVRERLQRRYGR